MNWEIVIHGTPAGQKMAASPDGAADQHIRNSYSDGKGMYMKSEHARSAGNTYCYYHFLHYGIAQYGGRPGGYLGVTLRTDRCSRRLHEIYHLLELIYAKCAKVLLQHGGFQIEDIPQNLQREAEQVTAAFMGLLFGEGGTPPMAGGGAQPEEHNRRNTIRMILKT